MLALLHTKTVEDEMNGGEPFDVAWDSITKAPFYEIGDPYGNNRKLRDVEETPYLYSGGDKDDSPSFWTDFLPDALGYALYGSAIPRRNLETGWFAPYDEKFVQTIGGMRETVPTIFRVKNPVDFDYPLDPDPNSEGWRDETTDWELETDTIPYDEMVALIQELIDDPEKIHEMQGNSAGWWFDDEDILQHTKNALDRLKTGKSGRLTIPVEAIPFTQTAFTDDYGYEVDDDEDF
jgi:hypothetical protein